MHVFLHRSALVVCMFHYSEQYCSCICTVLSKFILEQKSFGSHHVITFVKWNMLVVYFPHFHIVLALSNSFWDVLNCVKSAMGCSNISQNMNISCLRWVQSFALQYASIRLLYLKHCTVSAKFVLRQVHTARIHLYSSSVNYIHAPKCPWKILRTLRIRVTFARKFVNVNSGTVQCFIAMSSCIMSIQVICSTKVLKYQTQSCHIFLV